VLARHSREGEQAFSGMQCQPEIAARLWSLLVTNIQKPHMKKDIRDEVRSIGWQVFFTGSKDAMHVHYDTLLHLGSCIEDVPSNHDGMHDHLIAEGCDVAQEYQLLGLVLQNMWSEIGTWLQ